MQAALQASYVMIRVLRGDEVKPGVFAYVVEGLHQSQHLFRVGQTVKPTLSPAA